MNPVQLNESSLALAAATPSVIGTNDSPTGNDVVVPRTSLVMATLKTGSSVFTVWVREIATAAKEILAAICPRPCIEAGNRIVLNSSFVIGRPKEAFFKPRKYVIAQ